MELKLLVFVIVCASLSQHGQGAPDNRGKLFIIGFMQNHYENNDVELFVTTSRTTTVSVRVTSPKWSSPKIDTSFSITSGQVKQVFISNRLRMYNTAKDSKGLRIEGSDEVVVYGVNKETYSCDAFLAFPVDVLGKEYYGCMHHPTSYAGEIMVVATEDSTSVSFRMSCTVNYGGKNYNKGSTLTLTLQQYDCVQLQTFEDLTGTYITSTKPIAFYSGNRRTRIGPGSSSDHISEQLMPVDTWGKKFATVPIPTRTTGDYFRIVASEDNTRVNVNGLNAGSTFTDSFTLSKAGDFKEKLYSSKLYSRIEADKPIQIVQFVLSQVSEAADPAMIMIPPIEQYAADYVFSTPKYSYGSYTNYFVFIVSNSQRSGLRLDGNPFPSTTYNTIPGTDLVGGYIVVSEGTHTIRHTSPISVFCGYLFGLAKWESYGLPGGMRMAPVNTICVPTTTVTGDGIDNDCDGLIDEELCHDSWKNKDDDGDGKKDEDCATPPPVDGQWANWQSWTSCSLSCKPTSGSTSGTKTRTRTCTNPSPKYDGKQCVGTGTLTSSCTPSSYCPVHGNWGSWGSYGSCSVTCASGTQTRYRSCNNPAPAHNGNSCSGSSSSTRTCTKSACPIDGNWSNWGGWTSCTKSCGGGTQSHSRSCNNPSPQHGGKSCSGSSSASRSCNTHSCAVHGNWASWGSYGGCSLTCGGGTKTRSRTCTNPAPAHGGNDCAGSGSSSASCNTHNCPIDGGWANWGSWKTCSLTCGGGIQSRDRTCTNPSPQYGGANCPNLSSSSQACNTHNCPIDGAWSAWGSWATCSVTCGGGTQGRTRSCNNPSPQYGGAICPGSSSSSQACNTHHCPIDGGWANWGSWKTCSLTCGGGIQSRDRTCTNPSPQYGGANCPNFSSSSQVCNTHNCPIDGAWGAWGSWATCSVTCGGGTQGRTRSCNNPSPQYGGANCPGSSSSSQACNTHHCPIDGGLSSWSAWGTCTVTCGGGTQVRTRTCTNPAPQYGGALCSGSTSESQACNTQVCIIDGAWATWGAWGTCSVSCDGGKKSRARTCTDPAPLNGGQPCSGSSSELVDCNSQACPTVASGQYQQLCPTGWFTCQSGGITCIDEAFVCDCAKDCDDGSDEDVTYASCAPQLAAVCQNGSGYVKYSWTMLLASLILTYMIYWRRH